MRHALTLLILCVSGWAFSACQTAPMTTMQIAAANADQQRIANASAQWPDVPASEPALKRPFFATIHIAGRRTTASGLLQYHNARDFRITAATEMGVILFDGRMNWAGVTVMRSLPGVDKSLIASLVRDLATAFQLPTTLSGSSAKNGSLTIKQTGADTNKYTWIFDTHTGHLRETQVDRGIFDTLYVDYLRYNARGWPEEISVVRKARFYNISLTFTDDALAQRDDGGMRP